MTNQEFFDKVDSEVRLRQLEFDNEVFSVDEFFQTNLLEENVSHISLEEAQSVIDIEIGETAYFDWMDSKVKRVA